MPRVRSWSRNNILVGTINSLRIVHPTESVGQLQVINILSISAKPEDLVPQKVGKCTSDPHVRRYCIYFWVNIPSERNWDGIIKMLNTMPPPWRDVNRYNCKSHEQRQYRPSPSSSKQVYGFASATFGNLCNSSFLDESAHGQNDWFQVQIVRWDIHS